METRAAPMESGTAPVDKGSSGEEAPAALLAPVALVWLKTRLVGLRTLWRPDRHHYHHPHPLPGIPDL